MLNTKLTRLSRVFCVATALAWLTPVQAADIGVGLNVSSLGPGFSLVLGINEKFSARIGHNRYSVDDTLVEDGIEYDAEIELEGTSLLIDWHPFGGSFRVTGGFIDNGTGISGSATPSSAVEIGNTTYTPTQIGVISADIGFDSTAPYLGIGWGAPIATEKGFAFASDIGVMFSGEANVDLDAQSTFFMIPEADIQIEEQNVEGDIDDFDVYPIIRLGLAYYF